MLPAPVLLPSEINTLLGQDGIAIGIIYTSTLHSSIKEKMETSISQSFELICHNDEKTNLYFINADVLDKVANIL